MSCNNVRRIAGAEALAFKNASLTDDKRASNCCGKCCSKSRPIQVRTKNRHSI